MTDVAENTDSTIIYTLTDEAPALATRSLLPIIQTFAGACGIDVETRDISLAGRILAVFGDHLEPDQQRSDDLAELGRLTQDRGANIIKLPNISASVPQIKTAITELQGDGFSVPDYPDNPQTDAEKDIRQRYASVGGSAVNPVLREGNSDRRAPKAVKRYAQANPHSMGEWSSDCRSHVATMGAGDFQSNEQSRTMAEATTLRIEFEAADGSTTVLFEELSVQAEEVVDTTHMSLSALQAFFADQVNECRDQGLLLSLHMKATMMKVSDPIIFGHAVKAYFATVFETHGSAFADVGVNVNNGLGNLLSAIEKLPEASRDAVMSDLAATYEQGPALAMVNSDLGITNLHVPSDVIIDASMPAMIRSSGQMWNADGALQDTKAIIPDSTYADLYVETLNFCRDNGAFDPSTMGTVPNVGLMAQKAEEYGSHNKTFELPSDGTVRVVDIGTGQTVAEHAVGQGDIWRMCNVRHVAVTDWVGLAVRRARASGMPAVFWLDENRPHDAELIKKVNAQLADLPTDDIELHIMSVAEATRFTLERAAQGLDTISVTGNVLRDYLTDLFPILELGTSAKMLSIVPLMAGGGLFETGAGGSAPKHVQQFNAENHLRWDSLGEFLALAESLELYSEVTGNGAAQILSEALGEATTSVLFEGKSPKRKVNEHDNRGSHFYLALYWARELAAQTNDASVAQRFAPLAAALADNEQVIVDELLAVQGGPMDVGGYYSPEEDLVRAAMRPSATLNTILDDFVTSVGQAT